MQQVEYLIAIFSVTIIMSLRKQRLFKIKSRYKILIFYGMSAIRPTKIIRLIIFLNKTLFEEVNIFSVLRRQQHQLTCAIVVFPNSPFYEWSMLSIFTSFYTISLAVTIHADQLNEPSGPLRGLTSNPAFYGGQSKTCCC